MVRVSEAGRKFLSREDAEYAALGLPAVQGAQLDVAGSEHTFVAARGAAEPTVGLAASVTDAWVPTVPYAQGTNGPAPTGWQGATWSAGPTVSYQIGPGTGLTPKIASARASMGSARAALGSQIGATLLAMRQKYWADYAALYDLELKNVLKACADRALNDTKALHDAQPPKKSEGDVLTATLAQVKADGDVRNATTAVITANDALYATLTPSPVVSNDEVFLPDAPTSAPQLPVLSLDSLLRLALSNPARPDLMKADADVTVAERAVDITAASLKPVYSVSVGGTSTPTGVNVQALPSNVFTLGVPFVFGVGVGANWPLYDGGQTDAKLEAGRRALEKALRTRDLLRISTDQQVRAAYHSMEASVTAFAATRDTLLAANSVLSRTQKTIPGGKQRDRTCDGNDDKVKDGRDCPKTSDLISAYVAALKATSDVLAARLAREVAMAQLQQAVGCDDWFTDNGQVMCTQNSHYDTQFHHLPLTCGRWAAQSKSSSAIEVRGICVDVSHQRQVSLSNAARVDEKSKTVFLRLHLEQAQASQSASLVSTTVRVSRGSDYRYVVISSDNPLLSAPGTLVVAPVPR